jgi:hypothetical protein
MPALVLIHLSEETKFSIRQLRVLMGDLWPHSGPSAQHPTIEELWAMRTLRVETRVAHGRGRAYPVSLATAKNNVERLRSPGRCVLLGRRGDVRIFQRQDPHCRHLERS